MYWPCFKECEVTEPGFKPRHVSLQSPRIADTMPLLLPGHRGNRVRFRLKPGQWSIGKGHFSFVFGTSPDVDYATLPEKTSLQRAVKKIYLNGGYIHEGAGFFL